MRTQIHISHVIHTSSPTPSFRFLPGVSPAQPGLKINFRHADLLRQFPDAAAPYRVPELGCTMQGYFNGTLFRFPLRTEKTALQSDIKSTACAPERIIDLFNAFQEQLPSALMFLKHVQKVSVWSKPRDGKASLIFESSARPLANGSPSSHRQVDLPHMIPYKHAIYYIPSY